MRSEDEEDFRTGDVVVEPCGDGLAHAFKYLDDGQAERPACGSSARPTGRDARGSDVVCEPCIHLMGQAIGCNPTYVRAAVSSVKERKVRA